MASVTSPCSAMSKTRGNASRIDADAGVADLDYEPGAGRPVRAFHTVAGPHGHLPSRRSELDRVLDQVPEDLLEPDRVGVDVVA